MKVIRLLAMLVCTQLFLSACNTGTETAKTDPAGEKKEEKAPSNLIVDLPKLADKSPSEIEAALGKPEKTIEMEMGRVKWDYEIKDTDVQVEFKDGKTTFFRIVPREKPKTIVEFGNRLGFKLDGVKPDEANENHVSNVSGFRQLQFYKSSDEKSYGSMNAFYK